MKKLLEKQAVFYAVLRVLAFFALRKRFGWLVHQATALSARLNLWLNKPPKATTAEALAATWQKLMPPDGQAYYQIKMVAEDTAYTEIHLHCPLRGTGNAHACHRLMNYDRKLMEKVGGELVVLSSQADSGEHFCRLAIRPLGKGAKSPAPAHPKKTGPRGG